MSIGKLKELANALECELDELEESNTYLLSEKLMLETIKSLFKKKYKKRQNSKLIFIYRWVKDGQKLLITP